MLEVNPKYTDDSYEDYLNVIDARWIDIETGLFIDITAVRPKQGEKNVLCSKDQHEELVSITKCSMLLSIGSLTFRAFRRKMFSPCETVSLKDKL